MTASNLIKYWRFSLDDAEWIGRVPVERELDERLLVDLSHVKRGFLPEELTQSLFRSARRRLRLKRSDELHSVELIIAPLVFSLPPEHLQQKTNLPPRVTPLWLRANVSTKGKLSYPSELNLSEALWIRREYLDPTKGKIVLCHKSVLENFLDDFSNQSTLEENKLITWEQFIQAGLSLINDDEDWKEKVLLHNYRELEDRAFVMLEQKNRSEARMAKNIRSVYDFLRTKTELPQLLLRYASLQDNVHEETFPTEKCIDHSRKHLGHITAEFGLSSSQREAISHLVEVRDGEILAVNGPPGTGKTTLLHDVVTSLWIAAALTEKLPPIIAVSSTNNQAVTNVLDSMASMGNIKRWLPEPIRGLGLYLVNSPQKQKEAQEKGFHWLENSLAPNGLPAWLEDSSYIYQAKTQYLENAKIHFNEPISSIKHAIDKLQKKLCDAHNRLNEVIGLALEHSNYVEKYGSLETLSSELEQTHVSIKKLQQQTEIVTQLKTAWLEHVNKEPFWITLLAFIPPINKRRDIRNKLFFSSQEKILSKLLTSFEHHDVLPQLESTIARLDEKRRQLLVERKKLSKYIKHLNSLKQSLAEWKNAAKGSEKLVVEDISGWEDPDDKEAPKPLLPWLDCNLRFEMFNTALHYWEGKWLLEVEELLKNYPDRRERQNAAARKATWQRYAMLTPCFVTTMHSGPAFFDHFDTVGKPHLQVIDWLIVDEAGQVLPEVAGAMFALSKRAIVFGDKKQIPPVWGVKEPVDYANASDCELLQGETIEDLKDKGVLASSGSVMDIAQRASHFQKNVDSGIDYEHGLFLAEHRRCVPQILSYFNELAYGNRIISKRPAEEGHPWPHFGYCHVKGNSTTIQSGGSRSNEREAQTIVRWLSDNKEAIESHYRQKTGKEESKLSDLVGVVTPFRLQGQLIRRLLKEANLKIDKCGTIDSLQGAEKPIILFSSVYTTRDQSKRMRFDNGVNILNVSSSRSKDSFLVFGDMDIFDAKRKTPSGLLARYLFESDANELEGVSLPHHQELAQISEIELCNSVEGHQQWLKDCFNEARSELAIISPFASSRAVEADNVPNMISEAVSREIDVCIYVDDGFIVDRQSAQDAMRKLKQSGAKVKVVHNIHSKVICVDSTVFIDGSFNWLSAERVDPELMRMDTSCRYRGDAVGSFIGQTISEIESRVIKEL